MEVTTYGCLSVSGGQREAAGLKRLWPELTPVVSWL